MDLRLPEIMVESVRNVLGGVEIVQMTDMVTPAVKGVSSVSRMPYGGYLMTFRMKHLAALRGWWLTLDTDIVLKRDLSHVFNEDFDVALTKRTEPIYDEDGINVAEMMPYNTGVMFSKSHVFWEAAFKQLLQMPESAHKWWGDQLSVRMAADSGRFNLLELPCDTYNYSPKTQNDTPDVYVLHYKGKRKDWMLDGYNDIRGVTNSNSELVTP